MVIARTEEFRKRFKGLPMPIVELMIAGVIVGVRSWDMTERIAWALEKAYIRNQINVNGDGI